MPQPRHSQPEPAHELSQLSARLDELIRDVRHGARSQAEHDRLVARGEGIAAGVRAVFRGTPASRCQAPPLKLVGTGAWF